jgi:hypothetical protein
MVRSIAISAVTRVFDALWRCVSNHGHDAILAAILRDAVLRTALQDEVEELQPPAISH